MVKVHSIRESRQPAPMVTWVQVADAEGHLQLEMRWNLRDEHRTDHRSAAA